MSDENDSTEEEEDIKPEIIPSEEGFTASSTKGLPSGSRVRSSVGSNAGGSRSIRESGARSGSKSFRESLPGTVSGQLQESHSNQDSIENPGSTARPNTISFRDSKLEEFYSDTPKSSTSRKSSLKDEEHTASASYYGSRIVRPSGQELGGSRATTADSGFRSSGSARPRSTERSYFSTSDPETIRSAQQSSIKRSTLTEPRRTETGLHFSNSDLDTSKQSYPGPLRSTISTPRNYESGLLSRGPYSDTNPSQSHPSSLRRSTLPASESRFVDQAISAQGSLQDGTGYNQIEEGEILLQAVSLRFKVCKNGYNVSFNGFIRGGNEIFESVLNQHYSQAQPLSHHSQSQPLSHNSQSGYEHNSNVRSQSYVNSGISRPQTIQDPLSYQPTQVCPSSIPPPCPSGYEFNANNVRSQSFANSGYARPQTMQAPVSYQPTQVYPSTLPSAVPSGYEYNNNVRSQSFPNSGLVRSQAIQDPISHQPTQVFPSTIPPPCPSGLEYNNNVRPQTIQEPFSHQSYFSYSSSPPSPSGYDYNSNTRPQTLQEPISYQSIPAYSSNQLGSQGYDFSSHARPQTIQEPASYRSNPVYPSSQLAASNIEYAGNSKHATFANSGTLRSQTIQEPFSCQPSPPCPLPCPSESGNSFFSRNKRLSSTCHEHARARLKWAKCFGKTIQWNDVVFIDAMRFNFSSPSNNIKISLQVWAAICIHNKSNLVYCCKPIKSNADVMDTLQKYALPFGYTHYPCGFSIQLSNASILNASNVTNFLLSKHIKKLDWPSYSFDVAPFESIWDCLLQNVRICTRTPRDINDFFEILRQEWNNIPQQSIQNIICHMQNKINLLIANKGKKVSIF